MTIESFIDDYPANNSFVPEISTRREFGTVSPVRFMADIYAKEGTSGVRELSNTLRSVLKLNDKDATESFGAQIIANSAAIYLGVTVISIDEAIWDGIFYEKAFTSRLELAFSGSHIRPAKFSEPVTQELSKEKIEEMKEIATLDKTYGEFFENDYIYLPKRLGDVLRKSAMAKSGKLVLSGFVQRVELLLAAKEEAKKASKA